MDKRYFQEEYRKHLGWLKKEDGGKRLRIVLDATNSDLSHYDLSLSHLDHSNFEYTNLSFAKLRGARLRGAYFYGVNASDADLSETNLAELCQFIDVNLKRANLYKTIFPHCIIPMLSVNTGDNVQYLNYSFHYGVKIPTDNAYKNVYTIQSSECISTTGTSCLSSLDEITDDRLYKFLLKNADALVAFTDYCSFFYLDPDKLPENEISNFIESYNS